MKSNVKFLLSVTSILLLSSFVLVGCMRAISADNGEKKSYNLDMLSREDLTGGIVDDNPITQGALKSKFQAMYEISEDGKTITVISEDYLNNYWRSNYEKEVIHSLTTEEVYFIIQDSIRIYEEYDEVVLTGFASVSSMMQVAERFPFVKDAVIKTQSDVTPYYDWDDTEAIYEIILYRLKALSSPKAFFTGEEAIRFNGGDPALYSSMYPETVFYIPGYSETTDRDYILSTCLGNTDLFITSILGYSIQFFSKTYGLTTVVYPTAEMDCGDFFTTTPGGYEYDNNGKIPIEIVYGPSLTLNVNNTFTLSLHSSISSIVGGIYYRIGYELTLVCNSGDSNYTLVFYFQEGEGYRYSKEKSNPPSGYDFEDGTMFYLDKRG